MAQALVRRDLRKNERKIETKQIVIEEIKKEEEIAKNIEANADNGEVDTDDEVNEAEEYEAWKVREIARIKRDRDDRDALIKEREEVEKVRNMTEEERREWEKKNPKPLPISKKKWKFMQKYFHKGAFFQTPADDRVGTEGGYDIFRRDFSAPTGEDKLDKTILPKVMQVKHFGRSGRTKWTHLVAEDTTDWTDPYVSYSYLSLYLGPYHVYHLFMHRLLLLLSSDALKLSMFFSLKVITNCYLLSEIHSCGVHLLFVCLVN